MAQTDPVVAFPSAGDFRAWLHEHHATHGAIWLRVAKKGVAGVSYADALHAALCYGWIDGQKRPGDGRHWLQRFTARAARSRWSQVNRDKAEALIASGEMRPAGLHQIERAKADGRWAAAYAGSRSATVPDDLAAALASAPEAAASFAGLDRQNRYAILYRVQDAKRPQTRARRIEQFVRMLAEGRKVYP